MLRFLPAVQISFWLGTTALGASVGLHLLERTPALAWLPKAVSGSGFLEDNRQRVADAARQYREGQLNPADHLGAIVGISNVREGVDLSVVGRALGDDWHVLGLGGSGLGIRDVAPHANVLLSSELRPDLVVLGISLHQLVDTRPKHGALHAGFLEYVRQRDVRNAALAVRDSLWFYSRRQDVGIAAESALLDSRHLLLHRFGIEVTDSAPHSPWRQMITANSKEHFSPATLRDEEGFFEGYGVFDVGTYAAAV